MPNKAVYKNALKMRRKVNTFSQKNLIIKQLFSKNIFKQR